VSFEELRSLGIENPAVLCYELDLIGVPIARVNRYVAGRAVPVGVRIDESVPAEYAIEPRTPRWQRRLRRQPTGAPEPQRRLRRQPTEAPEPRAAPSQPVGSAVPLIRQRAAEVGRLARGQFESARAKGVSLAMDKAPSLARDKAPSLARAARPIAERAGGRRGLIALIALVAVAVAVIAIVLADQPGGHAVTGAIRAGGRRHPPGAQRHAGAATSRSTPAPSPSSLAREPTQLQAEGHQLLGEERYADAIAHLRAAVARSGESPARCAEPNSEACLTYAYALFDLGRALRLHGERSGAVAALNERLRINDQRGAVQEELSRATEGGGASGPTSR
jgi:hypothetical protein